LVAAGLGLTVGGGFVQGRLSHRWGQPPAIAAAVEQLNRRPTDVGPWQMVDASGLSEYEQSVLECHSHYRRVYRHANSGQTAHVSLLLGPAGPTSVHTPEACLAGRAYVVETPRVPLAIDGRDDRFWTVTFRATDVTAQPLRAVYAWRYSGPWEAAREPRMSHGTLPYLYKLQVICQGDAAATQKTCEDFLRAFLPVADQCMAPAP
jgi:hypothetical protein